VAVPAREPEQDKHLVDAVQGGDLDAFSELFRRHYPSVRRACARRLGDAVDADEVAQAAFVRALERIQQCGGERRFGSWVHVIARYLCIDHQRARARVVPHEAPLSDDHSDGARPEDRLLEREQHDRVHRAIAELPERQRRAVTARALGLRPGEIAATLGLSIGAVDSLLLRARRRLALTYTSAASEGGAMAAATGTSATASLGGALAVEPAQVADGMAGAVSQVASAVGSLPGVRPAGGLVSAVVGAALTFGGAVGPGVPVDPPAPPPAVTILTPAASSPSDPSTATGVETIAGPKGGTTVTMPAGPPTPLATADVVPAGGAPGQARPADETPAGPGRDEKHTEPLPPGVSDLPAVNETPSPAPEPPARVALPPPDPPTPTAAPPAPVELPPDPPPTDEPAPPGPSPDPITDPPGQRSSGPRPA